MRRTRQVLAVMLVATALCADRGAAALSSSQVRTAAETSRVSPSFAGRFFERLSKSFRGSVAVLLPRQARRAGKAALNEPARLADQSLQLPHPSLSPFQFRLPPPAC